MEKVSEKVFYRNVIETISNRVTIDDIEGGKEFLHLLRLALIDGKVSRQTVNGHENLVYDDDAKEQIALLTLDGKMTVAAIYEIGKMTYPVEGWLECDGISVWVNDIRGQCRLRIQGLPLDAISMEKLKRKVTLYINDDGTLVDIRVNQWRGKE